MLGLPGSKCSLSFRRALQKHMVFFSILDYLVSVLLREDLEKAYPAVFAPTAFRPVEFQMYSRDSLFLLFKLGT